ncbi:Protein of unknown function [Humidesulfovibrio mexicanus]|jgi:hypothetical protein|uniref:DUF4197 domain-containing protein n=1 Tax=Humidesulfovibrio mexicanus TaxID=147047 RepID=A0A238Y5S6_9BACT|nr:DUF4197 domain-containing protein [Humidesulfovibrio mexicanus]SNR66565.1 Protein of unknown function [Humidesulfovibrio mexicanus]
MKRFAAIALCLAAAVFIPRHSHAGWSDVLDAVQQQTTQTSQPAATKSSATGLAAGLSDADVTKGLKEALAKGVTTSITSLGKTDGYFGNQAVRILLPEQLQKLETPLRLAGQGKLLDDLVLAMNRAAEKAVPQAAGILGDAVKSMTVSDAKSILTGPDDAATQYFRKSSGDKIGTLMQPIISKATDSVGVAKAYKRLTANPLAANLAQSYGLDLDAYVNAKAQDGLFTMIAKEEKDIRTNPAERTTALLKKVFGAK